MLTVNYPTAQPTGNERLLLDRYKFKSEIFQGTYARVFCMHDVMLDKDIACKRFSLKDLTEEQRNCLFNEVDVSKRLRAPGQMAYISTLHDKAGDALFVLMDLHKYGDLRTQLDTAIMEDTYLSEDTIWMMAAQLVNFIDSYTSQTNMRNTTLWDLRPSSIYIDQDGFIIVDTLRVARFDIFPDSTEYAMPCYNAPELLAGSKPFYKMDLWSLGATLFELCLRRPYATGWARDKVHELIMELPNLKRAFTGSAMFMAGRRRYSEELVQFITGLLHPRPDRRPDTDELVKHPRIATLIERYKELLRTYHYKLAPKVSRVRTCACGGNMNDCCGYRRYLRKLEEGPPFPRNMAYLRRNSETDSEYTVMNKWASRTGNQYHRRYSLSSTFAEPRTRPLGSKRPKPVEDSYENPSTLAKDAHNMRNTRYVRPISGSSGTISATRRHLMRVPKSEGRGTRTEAKERTDDETFQPPDTSIVFASTYNMDGKAQSQHSDTLNALDSSADRQYVCDRAAGTSYYVTLNDLLARKETLDLVRERSAEDRVQRKFISPWRTEPEAFLDGSAGDRAIRPGTSNFIGHTLYVAPLASRNEQIKSNDIYLTNNYEGRPNRLRSNPSSMYISSIHSDAVL